VANIPHRLSLWKASICEVFNIHINFINTADIVLQRIITGADDTGA
jgi:hypothetical protein